MHSVLSTLDGVLLPLREVFLQLSFGGSHERLSDPPCATMKKIILRRHTPGRHLHHLLLLFHHHRNVHPVIGKVAHGVLNAARNSAGNLQLRGQSYSALRSDEHIKVVVTISSGQFLSVPVEEVVDNVMYSFKIVFVDRDIDKN